MLFTISPLTHWTRKTLLSPESPVESSEDTFLKPEAAPPRNTNKLRTADI